MLNPNCGKNSNFQNTLLRPSIHLSIGPSVTRFIEFAKSLISDLYDGYKVERRHMHAHTHAHTHTDTHTPTHINARPRVGWNWMKSTHSIHRQKPLSHELGSEWVSERASEWAQRVVRSDRMSEWCERTSKWTSEWPSTLRVDFISFTPKVRWLYDTMTKTGE